MGLVYKYSDNVSRGLQGPARNQTQFRIRLAKQIQLNDVECSAKRRYKIDRPILMCSNTFNVVCLALVPGAPLDWTGLDTNRKMLISFTGWCSDKVRCLREDIRWENTYGMWTGKSGPRISAPSQKQSRGVMMAHGNKRSMIVSTNCISVSGIVVL